MPPPTTAPDDGGRASAAIPAATVVLLRDGREGVEALMVRRSAGLEFAGGMWVFPGGRIDSGDRRPEDGGDDLAAARRAAVREAQEEAGVVLDEGSLVCFSNWTPPAISPKRFATWFFVAVAPGGRIVVDGGEIDDHRWMRPADAVRRRDAGEISLAPPTWITLWDLARYDTAEAALAGAAARRPPYYETHIAHAEGGVVALYEGDAGYEDGDVDRPGPRHRLWMLDAGWRYEAPEADVTGP